MKMCNRCGSMFDPDAFYKSNKSECKKCVRERQEDYRNRLRLELIKAYGGKCNCCGEKNIEFLTFDHVEGGGNRHRRSLSPSTVYVDIKRAGFPKTIRILCFNCNWAIHQYGFCPHINAAAPVKQSIAGIKQEKNGYIQNNHHRPRKYAEG